MRQIVRAVAAVTVSLQLLIPMGLSDMGGASWPDRDARQATALLYTAFTLRGSARVEPLWASRLLALLIGSLPWTWTTSLRLLTAVWGADCREEVEYLRTFIRQLRKKIEDVPSNPVYLLTDVYVGYRFADAQMLQADIGESAEDAGDAREEVPEGAS